MRIKLIACEVLKRETLKVASESTHHEIDVEFLPKWLHDLGADPMRGKIQEAIDAVPDERYDAICLVYALCNNGAVGLRARNIPVVIPRGHDCITLFLGSRERYEKYFDANPGVYFLTSGWMEYANNDELESLSIQNKMGMNASLEELIEQYGEDNARYIYETLCDGTKNYHQYTYIEMGTGDEQNFECEARAKAEEKEWKFEKLRGDLSLLRRLVSGEWSEHDFLVVRPGESVCPSYDSSIIKSERIPKR